MHYYRFVFNLGINWIEIIWIISILITLYDCWASKRQHNHKKVPFRVHENVLFTFGIIGGALPMYLIMKIRHYKTKNKKFMTGFPIMFIIHIIGFAVLFFITK